MVHIQATLKDLDEQATNVKLVIYIKKGENVIACTPIKVFWWRPPYIKSKKYQGCGKEDVQNHIIFQDHSMKTSTSVQPTFKMKIYEDSSTS